MFTLELKPPIELDFVNIGDSHSVLLPYLSKSLQLERKEPPVSESGSTSNFLFNIDTEFEANNYTTYISVFGGRKNISFDLLLGGGGDRKPSKSNGLLIQFQEYNQEHTYQRRLMNVDLFPPSLDHIDPSTLIGVDLSDENKLKQVRDQAETNNFYLQSLAIQMSKVVYVATKADGKLLCEKDQQHLELIKRDYLNAQKNFIILHEVSRFDNIKHLAQKLNLHIEEQPYTILYKEKERSGDVLLLRESTRILHFFIIHDQNEDSLEYNQRTISYLKNNQFQSCVSAEVNEPTLRRFISKHLQQYNQALILDESKVGLVPIDMYEWKEFGSKYIINYDRKVKEGDEKDRYRVNYPQSLSLTCGSNDPFFSRKLTKVQKASLYEDDGKSIDLQMELKGHVRDVEKRERKNIKVITKLDPEMQAKLEDARANHLLCGDLLGNKPLTMESTFTLPHTYFEITRTSVENGILRINLQELDE